MLTSGDPTADADLWRDLSISARLLKPIKQAELLAAVETALGTLSMTAERYAMALKPAYEEIDADRKQDLISEQEAIARRTALKQAEIDKEIATAQAKIVVLRGKADSERDGVLVEKIDSVMLLPTAYSPLQ